MARFVAGGAARGVTAVENSFLIDYMPNAGERAVKAYLYGLMAAGAPDAPDIGDALGMEEGELSEAFAYWQRMGLVRIASNEPLIIEFLRPQPISSVPRKYAALMERLSAVAPSRVFTGPELSQIYDWIETFGFEKETAALLISDAIERHGQRVKLWQMNAEARRWADNHVSTVEEAGDYIAARNAKSAGAQEVLARWNRRRAATVDEIELYDKWTRLWELEQGVILSACVELTGAAQPSFKYLDSVLATYRANGAITEETIAAMRRDRDASRELARMMLQRAGVDKGPTSAQQDDAYTWSNRLHMAPELLLLAAEANRDSTRIWAGIKRTVADWHERAISSLEDAKQDIEAGNSGAAKAAGITGSKKGRAITHAKRAYSDDDLKGIGVELLVD